MGALRLLLLIFGFALIAQNTNTYLGPKTNHPGDSQLVRLQLLIYDSPESGGLTIQSVTFDETDVPLRPRDIHGFRGEASFQVKPGKYKLHWVVQRDKIIWPRTLSHDEIVTIDPRDEWIQVTITADKASIL